MSAQIPGDAKTFKPRVKQLGNVNLVNLSIPLRTPSENGFFVHREAPEKRLFGFALGMRMQDPYAYLEVLGVPDAEAAEVFDKLRAILPWAALRLNFGILAGEGELRVEDGPTFDGQFPTVYPAHLTPRPIRVAANHQTQEADTLLFSALLEGAEIQALSGPQARPELRLACELFAAVDFEASYNAQFLALISILEIMAKPALRPEPCVAIVKDAMARMTREANRTDDVALRHALLDMHKGALHWKAESIRSSIRRAAVQASRVLGDADPDAAGKAAVRLYDERSRVVHEGRTASMKEARAARQLVREVLAIAAGRHGHIREQFPTS